MAKNSKRFTLKRRYRWLKRLGLFILAIALIFGLLSIDALYHFNRNHKSEKVTFGVSFSDKYAHELGLEPHQTLVALLDDVKVRRFRLMSYWDEIEPQPGQYDFSELDWEFDQTVH